MNEPLELPRDEYETSIATLGKTTILVLFPQDKDRYSTLFKPPISHRCPIRGSGVRPESESGQGISRAVIDRVQQYS